MNQIRAFADAAGYRPKPFRRKRTDSLGLVVRAPADGARTVGYLERMIYLAEVGAAKIGKHLQLHMHRSGSTDGAWPNFISQSRVDGVLVLGYGSQKFYERLKAEPVPSVAINDTIERTGIDSVLCDPCRGISDAVSRLQRSGHRSIGLVITDREFPTVSRRYQAYMDSMREGGIQPDPGWIIENVSEGMRGGQEAVRTYLRTGELPSAILFNDDWIAMGGAFELVRQGVRIPEDVSVVGYDNTAMSQELSPALSSVDNCENKLMTSAIEMLRERIDGLQGPARGVVVPSRLVWRASCIDHRPVSFSCD
jgi:DNA-binding LacI/PurR family transcriptional regulator